MATLSGTYGSNQTPCNVFTYETNNGTWYVCEGSQNVNLTTNDFDHLMEDYPVLDVEAIDDDDCFTWSSGIMSENELEVAVKS